MRMCFLCCFFCSTENPQPISPTIIIHPTTMNPQPQSSLSVVDCDGWHACSSFVHLRPFPSAVVQYYAVFSRFEDLLASRTHKICRHLATKCRCCTDVNRNKSDGEFSSPTAVKAISKRSRVGLAT